MLKIKRTFYSFLAIAHCAVSAENIDAERYIWNGLITMESLNNFKEKLQEKNQIHDLEFRQSRGAPASATIIVNELEKQIELKRLRTFARGQCASACAVIFLLGERRTLLPPLTQVPTHLMIHAIRSNKTDEINYGNTDSDFKKIIIKSKGRISKELLERVYETKNAQGGIYIFRDKFATIYGDFQVLFCVGDEKMLPRTCQPIKDKTPQDFGILIGE